MSLEVKRGRKKKRNNRRRQSDLLLEVDDLLRVSPFCAFRRGLSSHAAMHHCPAGYGRARVVTADHSVMPVDWLGKVGLHWGKDAKIDLQPIIIRLSARKLLQKRKISFAYSSTMGTQEKKAQGLLISFFLLLVCLQSSEVWNLFCWTRIKLGPFA